MISCPLPRLMFFFNQLRRLPTFKFFTFLQTIQLFISVKYTPQWHWLREELERVDREKTPWLIVLMHVPIYNSNDAHFQEGESMQSVFESWFVQYRVDVIFAGHVHAYERSVCCLFLFTPYGDFFYHRLGQVWWAAFLNKCLCLPCCFVIMSFKFIMML